MRLDVFPGRDDRVNKIAALLVSFLLIVTACAACSGRKKQNRAVSAGSFGADGSDLLDDRLAIQDALNYARDNAAADSPVTVTISDGVYYLEQPLIIYSHTRLKLNENAVLVYTGQQGLMIFGGATRNSYDAVTDVAITGGVWKGNASSTGAHTEPIGFHSASNITLSGLKMEDSSDHFVMLTGVSGAVVSDCTFKDHFPISDVSQAYKEALHIDFLPLDGGGLLPSENITVKNCRFDNVASGVGTHHFGYGKHESNISVQNCTFENIQYNCINAYSMVNLSVSGCTADNCPMFLWCNSTECRIISNTIRGSGEKCISINENSAALIKDNQLSCIGTGTGSATAIISADSSCVIENNEISDVDGRGIRIKGGSSMSAVRGNRLSRAATQGIFLLDTKAVVEKNEVDGCQGIWAESSETCIFENKLSNCQYGIMNHGCSSRISGNTVTDSIKTGIHITYKEESGGSAVIENNTVTGSGEDDLRIGKSCVNCVVRGNNPKNGFRAACSRQSDIVFLRNGKNPLPATPFVSCNVNGDCARLSWQRAQGAIEYVVYSYDDVNDRLTKLAVTTGLFYDINDLPPDSTGQYIVVSRNAAGAECFYTYPTNAAEVSTGMAAGNAEIIYSQKSVSVSPGEEALFKVRAVGSGLSFRWELRKKDSDEWKEWQGMSSPVITATAGDSWDGMMLRCAVTDSLGRAVVTSPTEVTLTGDTEILMQSGDVAAYRDEPVSFGVAVRGENFRVRWYIMKAGDSGWTVWKGQNRTTASTVADDEWDGIKVRCEITGKDGAKLFSKPVTVSLRTKLRIVSQPSDKSLLPDEDVKFEIKAVGEGSLQYQWYYKKSGSDDWNVWWGHDAAVTYATVNDSWQGMQIRCVVTDESGASVESRTVNITLNEN